MEKKNLLYKTVKFICSPLVSILFPYKIFGIENIKDLKGPYIICANHLSNIDSVYLVVSNKDQIRFMAKSELFKNRILGFLFSRLGAFGVQRGKGDRKALSKAQIILRNKEVLGIFIEGTRSKTGEFLRPKSGAALLAIKEKVPVVPVCITGGGYYNKVKLFKRTYISYGKPIYLNKLFENSGDIGIGEIRKSSDIIMSRIKGMRKVEPEDSIFL